MPRERQALVREGGFRNAEKFYILSYEGKVSEKKYFNDLRNSKMFNDSGEIEIIPLKKKNGTGTNPLDVKKLLKEAKDEYNFRKTDEFWLIIDKDHWEKEHHIDFNKLAKDCKAEHNFFLALSNPCFEIWLIMHLKDINGFSSEVLEKISINERVSDKKHYIDTVLDEIVDNGRGYNKRPNPNIFLPDSKTAIARAKALSKEGESFPLGLGSDVYKIVEKLIK